MRGYGCCLRFGHTLSEDGVDVGFVIVTVFFPPLSILLGLVTSALMTVAFVADVFASCAAYAVLGRYVRPIHDTLCSLCWFGVRVLTGTDPSVGEEANKSLFELTALAFAGHRTLVKYHDYPWDDVGWGHGFMLVEESLENLGGLFLALSEVNSGSIDGGAGTISIVSLMFTTVSVFCEIGAQYGYKLKQQVHIPAQYLHVRTTIQPPSPDLIFDTILHARSFHRKKTRQKQKTWANRRSKLSGKKK